MTPEELKWSLRGGVGTSVVPFLPSNLFLTLPLVKNEQVEHGRQSFDRGQFLGEIGRG